MTTNYRFPLGQPTRAYPAELSQIITLHTAITGLEQGGPAVYTSIDAWRTMDYQTDVPYPCVVIEWQGLIEAGLVAIGDGTPAQQIGLYGEITKPGPLATSPAQKFLIGILGVNIGNQMPQIPLTSAVGFAQPVSNVGVYNRLAIGAVNADFAFPGGAEVTIRARPIRQRSYSG